MTGSGDMAHDFKCVRGIAFDISRGYEQDHNRFGRLISSGICGSADNALKVCAFKVPSSAVGSPDLGSGLAARTEKLTCFT